MRIVVIDDNPADRCHFASVLADGQKAEVLAVSSVADNIERIIAHEPMMLLLDDRLGPLLTAEHSLKLIAEHLRAIPTVVMSSDVGPTRRVALIRLGAFECVDKDHLDREMLDLVVQMAAQRDHMWRRSGARRQMIRPAFEAQ